MKRMSPEERYKFRLRSQIRTLEEFANKETEWAEDLIFWYKSKKTEIPDDQYRACAYFINKEYDYKPGSLTLLYEMSLHCHKELPEVNKENAFDILSYRFKIYAKVLQTGGYDGEQTI